jgi:DNA helicase II / ATP-dependent DNA helicase PcrA
MVVAEQRLELLLPVVESGLAPSTTAGAVLLRGLNREQRRAVAFGDGPALVVAGPGTGKTEVITRRIAWLIATRRALPREILALTFTANAAEEMQARVDLLVPYGQADAAIHTFHAFGDRLLREHAFELGMSSSLRLLSRSEQILFLREHLFELGLERYKPLGDPTRFLGALVDLFARAKDEDLSAASLAAEAGRLSALSSGAADTQAGLALADLAAARAEMAGAFERYTQLMAAGCFLDHSDQVALALRLVRTRPVVRSAVARRYRYVLVDELQDTNRAQLELVLALVGAQGNVMAVGDPDQGIYGFRGARAGNVKRFESSFERVATIALRRNYRSLAPIVDAAERVLAANRVGAAAIGQVAHRRGRGVAVRHISFATPEAEADAVAVAIEERVRSGARASDFAILVRSNSETGEFVRCLRVRGISADDGAATCLFKVPPVRALVAFLRVVADPSDSLEAFTLAAAVPYQLQGQDLTRLLNGARRRNRSLLDALRDALDSNDPNIPVAVGQSIQFLLEHVDAAVALAATHTSGSVLYDYLRRSGMLQRLAHADAAGAAEARSVARFCELVRARSALLAQDRVCFLAPGLELDEVDDDRDMPDVERDAVTVLTVHRAKGLEFKTVFISGLVDGHFPVRSRPPALSLPAELVAGPVDDEGALAEERRLFYVALTRARDEVVLTSHEHGPHGRGKRRPSTFIAEAIDAPVAGAGPTANIAGAVPEEALALVLLPIVESVQQAAAAGPLTLSFSQIDEYLTCPERYRLRYDIGIPTPAHHALSYGTAIHQAIAAFHEAQARGAPLSEAELVGELRRAWQQDGYLSREHEEARFAAGADALRRFRAQQVATGAAPQAIERPFTFRLGCDEIRGRIDRIDEKADGAVITDYKSSDVRDQKRADAKARESLQLQVYALAHQAQTGAIPTRVQLHFVESGVVGSAQPTQRGLDKATHKLIATADAIRERKFEPKPSAITCGYCPFRTICSASAA